MARKSQAPNSFRQGSIRIEIMNYYIDNTKYKSIDDFERTIYSVNEIMRFIGPYEGNKNNVFNVYYLYQEQFLVLVEYGSGRDIYYQAFVFNPSQFLIQVESNDIKDGRYYEYSNWFKNMLTHS